MVRLASTKYSHAACQTAQEKPSILRSLEDPGFHSEYSNQFTISSPRSRRQLTLKDLKSKSTVFSPILARIIPDAFRRWMSGQECTSPSWRTTSTVNNCQRASVGAKLQVMCHWSGSFVPGCPDSNTCCSGGTILTPQALKRKRASPPARWRALPRALSQQFRTG